MSDYIFREKLERGLKFSGARRNALKSTKKTEDALNVRQQKRPMSPTSDPDPIVSKRIKHVGSNDNGPTLFMKIPIPQASLQAQIREIQSQSCELKEELDEATEEFNIAKNAYKAYLIDCACKV